MNTEQVTESFSVPCKLNLTHEEYLKFPATGSSSLKDILRSPQFYVWRKNNPSEPTPAMRFGTLAHMGILEPARFQETCEVMPTFEGKGSREAKEKWLLENHGKTVLTAEEKADIWMMRDAIANHKTARGLLAAGEPESSYLDQCPDTGLVRKVRPDYLRKGHMVVDVKTTNDAEPREFAKAIANFQYHLSGAMYLDVISNVTGQNYDKFIIVAVEKKPPYGVSVHCLDDGTIDAGRFLYRKALRILKECKDKDQWPGYPDEVLMTAIPPWAFPQESA